MKSFIFALLFTGLITMASAQAPPIPGQSKQPKPAQAKPADKPVKPPIPAVKKPEIKKPPVVDPKANPAVPNVPLAADAAPVKLPVPGAQQNKPASKKPNPDALAAGPGQVIDGSNWDDQAVADEYTKYTGKRVLLSSSTQDMEIRFYQRGPLTNSEAAILLDKVLGMEGYAIVPSGANEVKLLPKAQGTGASAPEEFEDIIDNPSDIPEGDAYISYFMRLNFIKPEEAVRTFTQSINALGPGAKIAPVPNASAIIITGKSTFIRKLLNQKQYIDVAAGNVSTVWVTLRFADAEDVAATLNEIMNAQDQRKTTAGVTNAATKSSRPPIPGAVSNRAGSTGGTSAGEDIPVQIVASPRLNKLFIMGRPVDIVFVEGLAREFDAPPNNNNFVKRKLRFMIASDFLQVASDALSAVEPSSSGTQGNSSRKNNSRQTSQNRSSQSNNRSNQSGNRSGGVDSVETFNVSDVPESMVIGKTLIVADNLANSILVQGPPESLRIISELIDKLDGRPQQVMISTVFGDMVAGNTKAMGVSWGATANDSGNARGAGTVNVSKVNPLADLAELTTAAGLTAASSGGLNLYGQIDNITATIRALETHSDFKVLSRPTVYTANNRKAVISSGRRIAVPTNTFSSGGNVGGATQSTNIEYRDVLLEFEVVPLINSEEEVTLRISLLNEDTQGSQTIDGNEIPTIVTESISTTVTIPNKATVVLGGLVTERYRNSVSRVPVLSYIPLLGRLFRNDVKEVDRRELLIFMQPTIISGEENRQRAQADTERRYKVTKPLLDFADGGDILPSRKSGSNYSAKGNIPESSPQRSTKNSNSSSTKSGLRYPTRR
jgi:general secretion pathway protein D